MTSSSPVSWTHDIVLTESDYQDDAPRPRKKSSNFKTPKPSGDGMPAFIWVRCVRNVPKRPCFKEGVPRNHVLDAGEMMFADAFLSGSWVVGCIMRLPLLPEKQRVHCVATTKPKHVQRLSLHCTWSWFVCHHRFNQSFWNSLEDSNIVILKHSLQSFVHSFTIKGSTKSLQMAPAISKAIEIGWHQKNKMQHIV